MKEKVTPIILMICLLFVGCSFKDTGKKVSLTPEISSELEQVVKKYFASKQPPAKVNGVIVSNKVTDYYPVKVDLALFDGKQSTVEVKCRKFQTDGSSYWRVEE